MHELSIALEVCRMTEERVGRQSLGKVVAVGLEVGDQSGVEADNLAFCLGALLTTPPFAGAKAVIDHAVGDVLRLTYLEVDDARADD